MFETLQKAPVDKIFTLMAEYAADARPGKIDLGIGVYKDAEGATPVMRAVRKAAERVLQNEKTKTYIGIAGNKGFNTAIIDLALGGAVEPARICAAQAPGGTGALRLLMDLLHRARPDATVWLSDPTWANHEPLVRAAGLKVARYPYFDAATRSVDFTAMMQVLDALGPGDIVLLHGCCHNPTGANLTPAQWDIVAASLARTGAFPLLDLAYLGFGDGIEADAYGTRKVIASVPEAVVAVSCSKNFGLYRERTGCAVVICKDAAAAGVTLSQLMNLVRGNYSQPPDHGAEIVRTILTDDALRAEWMAELEEVRNRMIHLRKTLVAAIRAGSNSADFDFIADHRGMFSLLGLSREQVDHLKANNAVYMIDDSRINVAGIPEARVADLAEALLAVR